MKSARMVVGVAGLPGSGKSEVTRWLERRGAESVCADSIGHELLEPGSPVLPALVERFGAGILGASGAVDRAKLGKRVFGNAEALAALNGLVHPELLRRLCEVIRAYRDDEKDRASVLVVDAALIPEWELTGVFDELIVVTAPRKLRAERLWAARGWSDEDLTYREKAQWSDERKRPMATRVLHNRESFAELDRSLQALLPRLGRRRKK